MVFLLVKKRTEDTKAKQPFLRPSFVTVAWNPGGNLSGTVGVKSRGMQLYACCFVSAACRSHSAHALCDKCLAV